MQKIPRIIFNFNDKCLNGCPFCFIPFDQKGSGDLALWRKILARAHEFSPDMISFSGCDPFYYDDFYTLLETTKKECYWGVDTSLIWLDRQRFMSCAPKLDQLSTSWDDVSQMPSPQRYNKQKFEVFIKNFEFVLSCVPNTVVHSLYSKKNDSYLENIADELIKRNVKTWSLYQFWPFDFIKESDDYIFSLQQFEARGKALKSYVKGKMDFEYVPYHNRANGYFFVSSIGQVYTTLPGAIGHYCQLGSIFDADIFQKWQHFSNPASAQEILNLKISREISNNN